MSGSSVAANRAPSPPKTTPLLEALKAEKAAQKEKETAIRQIAQQKRDEAKKKNANTLITPTASTSGAPLSKKAAKKAAAAAAAAAGSGSAQAQAPKPGVAGPSKPGPSTAQQPPNVNANANAAPPRPPKAPKAQRQQPRIPGPPAVPTDVSVASAANTGITNEPPAAAPRRMRPVIGLASRQFEAALSGAGVAGGERKSRRERERERAAAAAAEEGAPAAHSANGSGGAGGGASAPPPRKEKPPRRKDSVSGGVPVSTASGSSNGAEVRVPSILQRTDPIVAPVIVHRIDGDVTVQPQAGVIPVNFNANGPRGGGRGRGGRGGRARGGVVGGGVPVSRGGG
jgi:regulator of nonsense transcripts 3